MVATATATAYLLVLKGPEQGNKIPLNQERMTIGREEGCQIVVNLPAASRKHAVISCVQSRYYIEDLNSRNHTYVNNEEIANKVLLRENDRIRICDFMASFHEKPSAGTATVDEGDEPPDNSTIEATVSQSSNLVVETQSAEKLRIMLEIGNSLSKTLELDPLWPKIVDRLFDLFKQADRGFIILRDDATDRLLPKVIKARRQQDEANARFSKSIVRKALSEAASFLIADASSGNQINLSQSIADFRIRSVMCAPLLRQDGKAFGVIQLDTQVAAKKFTADDLNLLTGVANQASIALENARLHEETLKQKAREAEMKTAHDVQLSFLPKKFPEIPGYEFYAHYEPAREVGGDYYGFIPLESNHLTMLLGDVAGKGVAAALLMAKFSGEAKFCVRTEKEPAVAVGKLNTLMADVGLSDRFITLAAATIDPDRHVVTLVNAGHPAPMVYRRKTRTFVEGMPNSAIGLPLGILEDYPYDTYQVTLEPGDCIVVFTDGVTEAMNVQGQEFTLKGICNLVEGKDFTSNTLGECILQAVKQHAAGRSQHDDITLACLGRKPA